MAAFSAAVLAVVFGTLTMREAYAAIEWRVIFLVAAILPLGIAMERTGAAVLLANHGVMCCGRNLEEALVASQILEKAAAMVLAAGGTGKVIPIPEEFVRSERHRFLYKYGTTHDAP